MPTNRIDTQVCQYKYDTVHISEIHSRHWNQTGSIVFSSSRKPISDQRSNTRSCHGMYVKWKLTLLAPNFQFLSHFLKNFRETPSKNLFFAVIWGTGNFRDWKFPVLGLGLVVDWRDWNQFKFGRFTRRWVYFPTKFFIEFQVISLKTFNLTRMPAK